MPWPFDRSFMQLALWAGLAVGAAAPLIGTFLVHKRLSLMGDGVGHLAFSGVAAGLLLGTPPIWTALIVAAGGALAIERLRSRGKASGDLALALFFYGGIAAGVVLSGMAGSLNAGLLSYLFGSILTVSPSDVLTIVALSAAVVLVMILLRPALFAIILDEPSARVAGIPVDALNAVLAALTAVTVVAAMRIVGVLLIAAMMVLPVGSAQLLARSFRGSLIISIGLALTSVVVGLAAAGIWDLPAGGSIVLVAALAFGAATVLSGRHARTPRPPLADTALLTEARPGQDFRPTPHRRTPQEHQHEQAEHG